MAAPESAYWLDSKRSFKRYTAGTDRVCEPAETLARAEPAMPAMGITRLGNLTGLDAVGIPVWAAYRPNSRSLSVFQGKGLSHEAARASALFEAIETFHAENILKPLLFASHDDLRSRSLDVCRVASLPRAAGGHFRKDLRLLWINAHDLASGADKWMPFELAHTDYCLPLPPGSGIFPATSNGLASGNTLEEAISHALCEVVERDATALWVQLPDQKKQATQLSLESVDDSACRNLIRRLESAGLDVLVWNATSDVGVATFICTVFGEDTVTDIALPTPMTGMGCHPRREIALARALTEAAQSRLTHIAGARDDMGEHQYGISFARRLKDMVVAASAQESLYQFRDVSTRNHVSIAEDVFFTIRRLLAIGLSEVLVCDLTRDGVGIPVVRTVVPGLEGSISSPVYLPGRRAREVRGRA